MPVRVDDLDHSQIGRRMPARARRTLGEAGHDLGGRVGGMRCAGEKAVEFPSQRRELQVAGAERFADAHERMHGRGVVARFREVFAEFRQERRDADDRAGLRQAHDLGVAFQRVQAVADRRRPHLDHARIIGESGDETPVDRTRQQHAVAGHDPGGEEPLCVVVAEAAQVAFAVGDPARTTRGPAGEADVGDLFGRQRHEGIVELRQVGLTRQRQFGEGFDADGPVRAVAQDAAVIRRLRAAVRHVLVEQTRLFHADHFGFGEIQPPVHIKIHSPANASAGTNPTGRTPAVPPRAEKRPEEP